MNNPYGISGRLWLLVALASACVRAEGAADKALEDFKPRFAVDFGQIIKGKTGSSEFEYQPMNRNILELRQAGRLGEDWRFDAALMGLIWWPFNTNPTEPVHRTMRSEIRIREAKLRWIPAGEGAGTGFLDIGYFPYKYNPDAHNLGEYLYRSGTYPGIVYTTDGFQLMDDALVETYGAHLRLSHWGGVLTQDANLFLEPMAAPVGDITPAYELSLNLPFFQAGLGAAWNRGISWKPSRLRPRTPDNTYAKVTDVVADSAGLPDTVVIAGRLDQIAAFNPQDTVKLGYWNKRGLKLMMRMAVDLGFVLPEKLRGPEDLRLFMEAAVLGWENQGFFYEKRSQRMPVMVGLNLPTFTLLDLLSLQVEYYAARFDNTQSYTTSSLPIWDVESFSTYNPEDFTKDDWKWSLYAHKRINRLFNVRVQVANDHLRLREFLQQQSAETLTRRPSHWYYLVRLEFGI